MLKGGNSLIFYFINLHFEVLATVWNKFKIVVGDLDVISWDILKILVCFFFSIFVSSFSKLVHLKLWHLQVPLHIIIANFICSEESFCKCYWLHNFLCPLMYCNCFLDDWTCWWTLWSLYREALGCILQSTWSSTGASCWSQVRTI